MKKISWGLILLSLILTSCSKVVYLENMDQGCAYLSDSQELVVRKGDRVSIFINSKNPEVAAPFNIHSGMSYQVSGDGQVSSSHNTNPMPIKGGYKVDEFGKIDFPILGELYVEHMTTKKIEEMVKSSLIDNKYIDDPIVTVDFLDVKITVMGEVVRNGAIPLSDKGLNILEAISLSGGITRNAAVSKVTVFRLEDGGRRKYEADIRSVELFRSPCFALQQDDIVYIQPESAKMTDKEERGWRYWGISSGIVNLAVSLLILFR